MIDLAAFKSNAETEHADGRIDRSTFDELMALYSEHHGTPISEENFRSVFYGVCAVMPSQRFGVAHVTPVQDGAQLLTLASSVRFINMVKQACADAGVVIESRDVEMLVRSAIRARRSSGLGITIITALARVISANRTMRRGVVWFTHAETHHPVDEDPAHGFATDDLRACLPFELGLAGDLSGREYVTLKVDRSGLGQLLTPTVVAGDPLLWRSGGRTLRRGDAPATCRGPFRTAADGTDLSGLPEVICFDPSWGALSDPPIGSIGFLEAATA